jgi:nucleoside-diphosphate-sugar epimerase
LMHAVAEQHPLPRFLFISSLAARQPDVSLYAASKRQGEAVIAENAGRISWVGLRPPAVYGPGEKEMLPLFRWMARGIAFVQGGCLNSTMDTPMGIRGRMSLIRSGV